MRWHIDEMSDAEVRGWLAVFGETRRRVVAIKEGEQIIAQTVASGFRADLLKAGIGDGCYAFSLEMPHSLLDGEEHSLQVVDVDSGTSLTEKPIMWRSNVADAPMSLREAHAETSLERRNGYAAFSKKTSASATLRLIFDISDLVYYIGHHPNLTGIQRVQSSIVLAMMEGKVVDPSTVTFVSFDALQKRWVSIPTGFLVSLLRDLFLPQQRRMISFPANEARHGVLPGAQNFRCDRLTSGRSVLCLLGAAWVQQDYFQRVLNLKRQFGTKFVMMVHDLIPIYARETCDQGTARVFEVFLKRAVRHVDHYLTVSQNTAKDLRRYLSSMGLPNPTVTVTRNGSSFNEFLSEGNLEDENLDTPDRFVLFVSTIEGRKNHHFIFNIWRRMVENGDDPPCLVCVGRVGWKSSEFISELIETDYLDGKVIVLQDISDADLRALYAKCLFTVFPSFYEGWGLPVGESLAAGKICVCSDRASIPEVADKFGTYINLDDLDESLETIRKLSSESRMRKELEAAILKYEPVSWRSVAEAVAAGCHAACERHWEEPYPYPKIPYSVEISFAAPNRDTDGSFGDALLNATLDARRGYFLDAPLQERSFLLGEEARSLGVWAEPESWGTWMCQSRASMVLALSSDENRVFHLFLRMRSSGPIGNAPVRISASGDTVWEGIVGSESRDVLLRLRKRSQRGLKWWLLKLHFEVSLEDDTLCEIAKIDSRVPIIGFERLVVVPENDIKARLDVTTNLMFKTI